MAHQLRVLGDVCRYPHWVASTHMLNRLAAALLAPLLLGCRPTIVEREYAVSADGASRLTLRYDTRDNKAFNFHDLVLESADGDRWTLERTVWAEDAILPPNRRRWVSRLHTFDRDAMTAIIQTGTELPVNAEGVIHVEYAWMLWDVRANSLLSTIRVCDDPFETPPDANKDGG